MGGSGANRSAQPEFRALWATELVSVAGDQLAKVAVSVLVFQRTGSAVWTGIAYALTLLPPLISGPVLASLADRYPRREVMIGCCVVQAGFILILVPPGAPLGVIAVAISVVAAATTPYRGARGAIVLQILGPDRNKSGLARLTTIRETGQLVGLAAAAGIVATVGTTVALVGDAASFLAAALLLRIGLHARPAPGRRAPGSRWSVGIVAMWSDPSLRAASQLVLLLGLTAVPDGVIVPLVRQIGAPAWTIGPLLAADCVGIIVGAEWVKRRTVARQRWLIGPLAVLSMAALVVVVVRPPLPILALLLAASGLGSAYLPLAAGEITERVGDDAVGAVNGVLSAGLRASQGIAVVAGGAVAQLLHSAAAAIAAAGATGVVLTGSSAVRWYRSLQIREVNGE